MKLAFASVMVVLDVEPIDFITFEEALTLEADRLRMFWKCSLVVGVADEH